MMRAAKIKPQTMFLAAQQMRHFRQVHDLHEVVWTTNQELH